MSGGITVILTDLDCRMKIIHAVESIIYSIKYANLYRKFGKAISLGRNVRFRKNFSIYMSRTDTARLTIGDDVFFNEDCSISCLNSVRIGNHCLFGENVRIYDHNHTFDHEGVHDALVGDPIVIEDNCWIGTGCIILKGVTIGEGSIIAAGTTVAKSIPPHSLVRDRIDLVITEL